MLRKNASSPLCNYLHVLKAMTGKLFSGNMRAFLRYGAAHHQGEHNKGASHNSRNPEHVEVSEGRRLLLAKFIEDA